MVVSSILAVDNDSRLKVDRVLANHSLSSTASQGTSNIPFPSLLLGCNRQAKRLWGGYSRVEKEDMNVGTTRKWVGGGADCKVNPLSGGELEFSHVHSHLQTSSRLLLQINSSHTLSLGVNLLSREGNSQKWRMKDNFWL